MEKTIQLHLTRSEALVLYETLQLLEEVDWTEEPDRAGILAIRKIEAQLDNVIFENFDPEYNALLAAAKQDVLREE